ncbi:MAG: hypothetical protein ACO3GG_02525 [Ilumatobacteraceae bacterium]
MTRELRLLSRRGLLRLGTSAVIGVPMASLIAACGDSDRTDESGGDDGGLPAEAILAARWIPTELGPGHQRLPLSIGDASGLTQDGPERLDAKIVSLEDDSVVVERISAERRSLGEGTIPFWTFHSFLERPGFYGLVVEGGPDEGAAFQIQDVADLSVDRVGDTLTAFDTPTFDDSRGVEVVCTRQPEPCPFHDVTLTEALSSGRPVVYLVGTPAHCQTGVCGPVLEQMIELATDLGDTTVFVHSDVYADRAATEVAPAVRAARLTFEPTVFVTDASGVVIDRLDAVWDAGELRELLS